MAAEPPIAAAVGWGSPAPRPDGTVLVLRFGALGDVVLTAPALRALRVAWPAARLVGVTHARFAPLWRQPWLDAVEPLRAGESLWALRRRLLAQRPVALLDLHGKPRGRALALTLPGLRRVCWHKRDAAHGLAVRLGGARATATAHMAARYHAAVEALVGRRLPRQMLAYTLAAADVARADAALAAVGLGPGAPIVGLSPGAAWASKRWPPAAFAALARALLARGLRVMLSGSPAERPAHAAIAAAAPGTVDLSGALDVAALPAAIARCSAFVANDSGPMHLGRALGVPTCALFGPTDPRQFDFAGHVACSRAPACAPCSFYGQAACPRGHHRCLAALPPAQVLPHVLALLAAGPVPPVSG